MPTTSLTPTRLVVLVSGTGSLLQSLIDRCADESYGARVVAVGADRPDIEGLARAERAGIPTFVRRITDHASRAEWDAALADAVAAYQPDWVISAGFMKLLGERFLARFAGRTINTHPALLPAFPGAHAVRDALAHGVKVTGCSVVLVDGGIDTGPILAQRAVEVRAGESETSLHERIKAVERDLLVETVAGLCAEGLRRFVGPDAVAPHPTIPASAER